MGKIIAICNHKGGVGKTTTSINLGASLAHLKRKVLLIDLDPQGNSSRGLGVDISLINKTIFDALILDCDILKIIRKSAMKSLEVVPSNLKLSNLESEIISKNSAKPFELLKNLMIYVKNKYDYILIDCPPSLGILSLNALVAADSVLVPIQCEYFAMEGLAQVLATIKNVQSKYNQTLQVEGFLLTMFEPRSKLGNEVVEQVRKYFLENTYHTIIPRNISLSEASAKGLPSILYRPNSAGTLAYNQLAKEIIQNEKSK